MNVVFRVWVRIDCSEGGTSTLESVNKIQAKVVFLELAAEFYLDAINILSNIYFVEKYWHKKFVEMKQ